MGGTWLLESCCILEPLLIAVQKQLLLLFIFFPTEKIESKVAFGTAVERKLFPVHSTPTRLGIEQGLRGEPHRGPGCYAEDPVSLHVPPDTPHYTIRHYTCSFLAFAVPAAHELPPTQPQGLWVWSHTCQETANCTDGQQRCVMLSPPQLQPVLYIEY